MWSKETEKYTELPISQESIDYLDVEIKKINQDIIDLMVFPNSNAQAKAWYSRYLNDVAKATKSRMIELLEKRTHIIKAYILNIDWKLSISEMDNWGKEITMSRNTYKALIKDALEWWNDLERFRNLIDNQ
jgi:hypothetical protein